MGSPSSEPSGTISAPLTRPAVTVVVPFLGSVADAGAMFAALGRLRLRPGDELIVADNTPDGVARPGPRDPSVTVVPARELRSSYYARNIGAERAANDWLLFLDSDCLPGETLLDDYFGAPIDDRCGAVAGEIVGLPEQTQLTARYARSRRHLRQEDIVLRPTYRPMAVTANLLVRKEAWAALGGFYEGIRSAGDADFSWRLQDAGWALCYRAAAEVAHQHRERLRSLVLQAAGYGAGRAWARHRYPDFRFPNPLRGLARCAIGIVVWVLTGRWERALFKAMDALWISAESVGYLLANSGAATSPGPRVKQESGLRLLVLTDEFPALTETFVLTEIRALERAGHDLRIEAAARPLRPNRVAARGLDTGYLEDDGIARKAADLLWLVGRHPVRAARDLRHCRRWRREEEVWPLRSLAPCARRMARRRVRHVHAHFASGAALNAMRLSRLLGVPYSVTAHAYDVFRSPRNLREKLERAAFSTSVCEYTVDHLRGLVAPSVADRVHRVPMGIEGDRFRRRSPAAGGRTVVAVGRLVEKKGMCHLVDAAGWLESRDALDAVRIVGDGPLLEALRRRVDELRLEHRVELLGALDHERTRSVIEAADLLVMPSVVAPDGDRDSLPVVVLEALALEVPVVASAVVGLPEVVHPSWGRLVPPGDPYALAGAIDEVLALPAAVRTSMGREGRAFVLDAHDPDRAASRLTELMTQVR